MPRDPRMPNIPAPPDWDYHQGKIYLPPTIAKSIREEKSAEEKAIKGKLFSNWSRTITRTAGGAVDRSPNRPSHALLKYVARNCTLDSAIISTLKANISAFTQVAHVEGKQIGFRVVHKRYNDPAWQPDEETLHDINDRCRQMERLILNTTKPACPSFATFMSAATDDELTIDRANMVIVPDRQGRPLSYHYLPGGTLLPRFLYLKEFMARWGKEDSLFYNDDRAAQRLSEELKLNGVRTPEGHEIDLTHAAFVQVLDDNTVCGAWTEKQLAIDIINPMVEIDQSYFGTSPVEQSLDVSYLWNSAWNYQKQLFQTTWPEAILLLHGDYSPEGLQGFKDDVLASHGNSQRLPVISGGPKGETDVSLVTLRNTPQDMLFDQLLKFMLALKCAFFRIHPSTINFASEGAASDGGLPQDRNYIIQQANEEGNRSRLRRRFGWLTHHLIIPWYDDLIAIPEGMDMVPFEQVIQREIELSGAGIKTKNETRAQIGLPPMPDGLPGSNLGDWTGSQVDVAIVGAIQAQEAMKQQQQAQMNPQNVAAQQPGASGGDYGADQGMPQGGATTPPPQGQPPQPGAPPTGGPPAAPPPPPAQKSLNPLTETEGHPHHRKTHYSLLWSGGPVVPRGGLGSAYMEDDEDDTDDGPNGSDDDGGEDGDDV